MAVMGLADGLLAGFNAMNHYQRGQKADERAERELGLRDAMWQNNMERQQKADERYADETAYARTRDSKNDEREARRDGLYEEQVRTSIASTKAANVRAASAESRAREEHQWIKELRDKQAFQQENQPVIQMGWQSIAEGKDPGENFWNVVRDKRAGQFNPERYMDAKYANAGKAFVTHVSGLMRDVESGKLDWNSEEGVKRINDPKFLKEMGVLYQEEIKTGIGDIDPKTGKTIQDKELGSIMVTSDGAGAVLGVKVTYDDGSTAMRPVTNNRTAAEDDHPKVISITDLIGTGYKRAVLSRELVNNADSIRTSLGLTPGADVKGYRQAVVKVQADSEKAISQIRRDSMLSSEEKEGAIASEREAVQQQVTGLRDAFGLTPSKPTASEEPAGQQRSSLSQWVSHDPMRQAFLQDAVANGRTLSEQADPAMLDAAYGQWVKRRQDSQTAQSLRAGNSEAPARPEQARPDPRAAEKAALNALVDPFKNTPALNNKPDGLAALQAMYNR